MLNEASPLDSVATRFDILPSLTGRSKSLGRFMGGRDLAASMPPLTSLIVEVSELCLRVICSVTLSPEGPKTVAKRSAVSGCTVQEE